MANNSSNIKKNPEQSSVILHKSLNTKKDHNI